MGSLETKKILFFLLLFIVSTGNSYGVEKNTDITTIQKDIEVVQSIISQNTVSKRGLLGEITNLEYQVIAAQKIIKLINNQVSLSNEDLVKLESQLEILKIQKEGAIKQYQAILIEEYKNRDYKSKLYFLASSKNISEFVNRLNHLNTLKEFRKKQLRAIDNKMKEVDDKLKVYKGNKEEKGRVSKNKIDQIGKLNSLLRVRHQKYKELEEENNMLEVRLKAKQSSLDDFSKKLETALGAKESKSTAAKIGRLSWPVTSGLLVGRFGVQKHKRERKVKISNNGIDLLVSPKEVVYAARKGTVKAILDIPGSNTSIIIDHGKFFTVYSNLQDPNVAVGDVVSRKQQIAQVGVDGSGLNKLHFEVWNGTSKMNPEEYLEGEIN